MQVIYGWVVNFRALDPWVGLIFLSLIFTPLFLLPVGGFFNAVYLQVFGVKQEMLYVGAQDYGGMYIDLTSPASGAVSGPSVAASDSVKRLYYKYVMIRDPLQKEWAGELKGSMGVAGILWRFLFALGGALVAFSIIMMYSEYLYDFYKNTPRLTTEELVFGEFLSNYGITLRQYWVAVGVTIPIAIIFNILFVGSSGEKYLTLPNKLKPGSTFVSVPQSIDRVQKKEYYGTDRKDSRWVDTPYYDVYFVSDESFLYQIYGSARFDLREYPQRAEEVNAALAGKEGIRFEISVSGSGRFEFAK